ncbi:DUF481 domain-containing protein [Celerinatantimonas yamalensis]|uniref:DUF481 domain-containing protein n=1 Tax=Celerinatantimonas yamalensis TaxID=559956 RepID=A0ABW9GAF2_9GAMM
MAFEIKDADLQKKGYAGEAEAGVNLSTGNSDTSSGHGRLVMDFFYGKWRHNTDFEANYAKDSGKVSAERYYASYKINRDWNQNRYTYGLITYENDRFNGLDNTLTTSLGYGYQAFSRDTQTMDIEIGPGWRHNESSASQNEAIFHIGLDYLWNISASAAFHQTFSSDIGNTNTMSRSVSSLTNNIWGPLALKTSVTLTHQTTPTNDDDPTPKHLDTVTAITLLYSF